MPTTFVFSGGVLAIDAPLAKMRIRWRPEPLAEELIPGSTRWKSFAPGFRLVAPDSTAVALPDFLRSSTDGRALEAKTAAFAAFHNEVPSTIVQAVGRFQSHQWLLMLLLHRQPAVFDLVQANPVLAYCLANNDQFRGTRDSVSLQLALGHSRQKQRTLMEWLGFPGTQAMARIMRRIAPEAASPSLLRRLRNAIQAAPTLPGQLAHVPALNAGVLELVADGMLRPLVAPRLLLAVAGRSEELTVSRTADQLATAICLQRQTGEPAPAAPFETLNQVARFEERMDAAHRDRARRHVAERRQLPQRQRAERPRPRVVPPVQPHPQPLPKFMPVVRRPMPPPPLPGTTHIIPITTPKALFEEGEIQDNCVATYLPQIEDGVCYIYRVTAPERATLSIVPTSDGGWRRSELKGPRNHKVREITRQTVDWWLLQNRLSVG